MCQDYEREEWVTEEASEIEDVINRIVNVHTNIYSFWRAAHGWAPEEAADLLSIARLDRLLSLSRTLKIWTQVVPLGEEDGRLILAWSNLGSLVEGSLKLFLSVYYRDYSKDIDRLLDKDGELVGPDRQQLEKLIQFLRKLARRGFFNESWIDFLRTVQQRRNAIHAFRDRELGSFDEFFEHISRYHDFLTYINERLPYPDIDLDPWR